MLDKSFPEVPVGGATDLRVRSHPNEEAELKFAVPADAMDRLREAPLLLRHARDGGIVHHQETVYYDTPDRTLFRHGLSLRVRHSDQRFIQTLKRSPLHGEPFVRGEWEAPVHSMTPDLALFPIGEIGAPMSSLGSSTVAPVFVTKVQRRAQELSYSGAALEVAFDDGVIESDERSEPLAEIEFELKAGDPLALYDFGLELLEIAGPLRIGTQSKSDRGYGLAYGLGPRATKATPPAINAEHTVDDVIGILLGDCQHHLLANQAVAELGRDPEGVHQMRVALRRIRTISSLFRQHLDLVSLEDLSTEAKWLGRLLGDARDWDVFVTDMLRAPSKALGPDVAFDDIQRAAEPHRIAAYTALREALATPRYNRFQLSMRRWIQAKGWRNELRNRSLAVLLEPVSVFAGRTLTQLHRKALKKGKHLRKLQPEARHQLRIALKKLRYATDFFHASHGVSTDTKSFLGCVAALQEVLGHENDASVTAPLLSMLEQTQHERSLDRAIGVVMGWQARDRLAHQTHWSSTGINSKRRRPSG